MRVAQSDFLHQSKRKTGEEESKPRIRLSDLDKVQAQAMHAKKKLFGRGFLRVGDEESLAPANDRNKGHME